MVLSALNLILQVRENKVITENVCKLLLKNKSIMSLGKDQSLTSSLWSSSLFCMLFLVLGTALLRLPGELQ